MPTDLEKNTCVNNSDLDSDVNYGRPVHLPQTVNPAPLDLFSFASNNLRNGIYPVIKVPSAAVGF